ncbi:hypothetical protein FQR65_LT04875 [Abscondita terminalis]|nr:hypothetical protein FQR65_LT04875 [Abscondita terminalis]
MSGEYKIIDNVIYTPDASRVLDDRGIGWFYYEHLIKHKNRRAQINGLTGETENFENLFVRCVRVAIGLKTKGISYGDTISVCTYNHFNSCVPHISAMFLGAKIAGFDPSLSVRDAVHLFKIAMPKLVFVGEESVALMEDVIREVGSATIVVVFGATDKHVPFSEISQPSSEESTFQPIIVKSIKDVAIIIFSSGTSGLPKGVCHTHHSVLCRNCVPIDYGVDVSETFASDSPYWNVFIYTLHYSIQNGTARLLYPKFYFENPWKIFSIKVSSVFLNLTELMLLTNTPKPKDIDISALKLITTAGSPTSKSHMSKIKEAFPNVSLRICYGLSEVFQVLTCFDMEEPRHVELMKHKVNSCGLPKSGITIKVVDLNTGEVLGSHQKGELRIKTEMQLSGYYNTDSREAWDDDGWLKTGDYGYYDEDCCFYILDRVKEMFKYQYWHIVPAVLEGILTAHPDVLRAVVIGRPHEVDEHHPMAVVQLNQNATATEAELVQYMKDKVEDRQQLRGGVKFIEKFPITPSGKINRWMLKQMVLSGDI